MPDCIYEQTLYQDNGYALTMIWADDADSE